MAYPLTSCQGTFSELADTVLHHLSPPGGWKCCNRELQAKLQLFSKYSEKHLDTQTAAIGRNASGTLFAAENIVEVKEDSCGEADEEWLGHLDPEDPALVLDGGKLIDLESQATTIMPSILDFIGNSHGKGVSFTKYLYCLVLQARHRLIIEGKGKVWLRDQKVRFLHVDTGGYLHSHDKKYSRIVAGQQEVCSVPKKNSDNLWIAAEGVYFPACKDGEKESI
ncbi:hypothetical protein R1flu_016352 [Riccia fluitans]|uniref:MIR domain-containing protein n=1 Tax=Riccia fluitans TaxID=41844 RepID=A0ABD1YLL2_9MARC